MKAKVLLASIGMVLAAPVAEAQTLYKLIDKNGKVTYVEKPPKDYDGKVVPVVIDPKANTATLPKAPAPGELGASAAADRAARQNLQEARARLDAARKALADARDHPKEGDLTFIGNAGGGTRPVQSDAYKQRLAKLEAQVKQAEEDVRRAESGR